MDENAPQVSSESQLKLTDWAKQPDLQSMKQDLEAGRQSHQSQMIKINRWNDLMKVTGKSKPETVKGRSSVQPKLIRRQAEWRYSALSEPFLGSNKLFNVKPVTFEDADSAVQNELVLNWQFRTKMNRVKLVDDIIRATVDEGTGILRVGWKRVEVTVQTEVPVFDFYPINEEESLQQLQQAIEMKQEDPRHFDEQASEEVKQAIQYYEENQVPVYAVQNGTQMVPTQKLLENRPLVEVLNPHNFIVDPSCGGDIDKAMFAVVSFETCKADLLKEPQRYKNLVRRTDHA